MSKLLKPIAFLFIVALSSSAMAQQGGPDKKITGKPVNGRVEMKVCPKPKNQVRSKNGAHVKQVNRNLVRRQAAAAHARK